MRTDPSCAGNLSNCSSGVLSGSWSSLPASSSSQVERCGDLGLSCTATQRRDAAYLPTLTSTVFYSRLTEAKVAWIKRTLHIHNYRLTDGRADGPGRTYNTCIRRHKHMVHVKSYISAVQNADFLLGPLILAFPRSRASGSHTGGASD